MPGLVLIRLPGGARKVGRWAGTWWKSFLHLSQSLDQRSSGLRKEMGLRQISGLSCSYLVELVGEPLTVEAHNGRSILVQGW